MVAAGRHPSAEVRVQALSHLARVLWQIRGKLATGNPHEFVSGTTHVEAHPSADPLLLRPIWPGLKHG